jgi:hypothetical protein
MSVNYSVYFCVAGVGLGGDIPTFQRNMLTSHVSFNHWYLLTSQHGVATQNSNIGILTAARTANLMCLFCFLLMSCGQLMGEENGKQW